jgi:hypothetical protein
MLNVSSFRGAKIDPGGAARSRGEAPRREFPHKTWKVVVVLVAAAMMVPVWHLAPAQTPAASAGSSAPMSQEKLDSLLAPIALYPDELLAQTLMASTYPLDVVAAARFVKENPKLKGEALDKAVLEKNWDPSVQSLTAYPQVLEMMNNKLDWTQELGDAFLADEKRVLDTVQGLRQKANAAGNLKSNEQQKVVKEQQTIIIEPAQPDVIYVPTYNPTVVYGSWWAPAYPPYYYPPPPAYYPPGGYLAAGLIGFGIGVAIADNHWGWGDCDWNGGNVNVNVNKNNTFINNNAEFKNKVKNGNWQHNPAQRKGVAYRDAGTREQFRRSDPGATAARRDARGYDSGRAGPGAGTQDIQRDLQRGGGDAGRAGPSAGARDTQRGGAGPSAGTRDTQRGGASPSAGTRDMQRGGGDYGRSNASPSFNAGQSRQQASSFSSRGASSRASMGGGGGGGARGGGGGGRGGGGRR